MDWIPASPGGGSSFPDYTQSATPASPTSGEFWWDTSIHVLKRYDGSAWRWVGLDDLANVDTAGKADTNIVEWDTTTSSWMDVAKPSGGGGSSAIVDFVEAKRTSGNITVSNNTDPDTLDSGLDLTVTASAGDLVLVGVSALWNTSGGSNWTAMDACTMVSGSKTNYVSTGSSTANSLGEVAWFGTPGDLMHVSGQVPYTVVAGDITTGQITLRLLARSNGANRVLRAGSSDPIKFWATNLGQ